ncbi:MAG: LysM peptidoglycan-binding domain-containing protein [Xanthobacteraceae bacterium]|nr:LysM peptidoglycan-binding domain-containing protein [Xanthobacteraceae bacterium]MBV9632303.1 LysM peptidoglycan-binding domain-containing protein [Xanthobacteraceae bacterium]
MPDALVGWTQFPDIMIKPTQICLIAAILSGSLTWGALDQAAAGDAGPDSSLKPRAYLFRGFAGMIFSRGTDDLADRIEKAGFEATVNEAVVCPQIAKDAIAEYRRNPALIVLIGHSIGGACAISFAEMLEAEHIPVSLLVTTEPNRIAHKVPLNVQRYIDIYQSNSLLGGFDAVPAPGFRGHVATFDLVKHDEISHVNMEKNSDIQDQVMNKILELADTPAKVEGQLVPIHYVVPQDSAIDLWDSGRPVTARSGDSLETLAAAYHVPLWALTQANHLPDGTPLAIGTQIVVPRHLAPLAVQTSMKTSGKKRAAQR